MTTAQVQAPTKVERPTVSPGRLFIGGEWREAQSDYSAPLLTAR